MKPLSISAAWQESSGFIRREAGLLIPVGLALIALPTAFLQAVMPQVAPGQQPELGSWAWLFLPVAILTSMGTLAITVLALGRETVVGSALGLAARRVWPLLAAGLILLLAAFLCLVPIAVLLGFLVPDPELLPALMVLLSFPVFLFAWVRLMLTTPVAAAEPAGPIAIIRRSWALTRGHTAKLFGFALLVIVTFVVVALAVRGVVGSLVVLLAGQPDKGSLSFFAILLVEAALNTAFVLYFATLLARIYAQLAAQPTSGT